MKRCLNLMSDRSRGEHLARSLLIIWLRIGCVALLFCMPMTISQAWDWYESKIQLQRINQQYEPTRKLRVMNQQIEERLKNLTYEERALIDLAEYRSLLSLFGLVGDTLVAGEHQVAIGDLEFEQPVLSLPSGDANSPASAYLFSLTGMAKDKQAVEDFVASLEASRVFREIQLETHQRASTGEEKLVGFSIDCHFETQAKNE